MARISIDAIVPAAGSGQRFKGFKQFYKISGKPLIVYTLQLIQIINEIDRIIIVTPPAMIKSVRKMLKDFHIPRVKAIVSGGKRRIDSVRKGLKYVRSRKVIIHDAVRPAASYRLFKKLIKTMQSYPAVIPVIPIHDTIKKVKKNYCQETVPRNNLYCSQTPQGFDTAVLRRALQKSGDRDYTDEAAVLEDIGVPVRTIRGEITNIKITDRPDIVILRKIL